MDNPVMHNALKISLLFVVFWKDTVVIIVNKLQLVNYGSRHASWSLSNMPIWYIFQSDENGTINEYMMTC